MIAGTDVRKELNNAEKIIKNPDLSVHDKLMALWRCISVGVRLALNLRSNQTRIMDKLGIPKEQKSEKKEEKSTE